MICTQEPWSATLRRTPASNRGVQVWPRASADTFVVDHFHCRFIAQGTADDGAVVELLGRLGGHRWMHVEKLQRFDGKDGFARAQGEG